jgi:glutamate transport system substrate-binding protein
VRADDTSINGKDTLKGKKVCGVSGTTPLQRARDQGLTEEGNITKELTYRDCVVKLLAGDVDALTTDDSILRSYAWEEPYKLRLVGHPFSDEPYGIGLSKDDTIMRTVMNDILQTALDDGTWQSIYDRTLGTSGPPPRKPVIQRY